MFQPVPTVVEARLFYTDDTATRVMENVLHFSRDGGWTDGEVEAFASTIAAVWNSELAAFASDEAQLLKVTTRDLTEEFNPTFEDAVPHAGTKSGANSSYNNAACLKLTCAGGSAPRRGFTFWPWVLEADVARGGELSGYVLGLPDAFSDFIAGVVTVPTPDAEFVVVSRYSKTAWIAAHPGATDAEIEAAKPWIRAEGVYSPVATITLRSVVGSQRDRRDAP